MLAIKFGLRYEKHNDENGWMKGESNSAGKRKGDRLRAGESVEE